MAMERTSRTATTEATDTGTSRGLGTHTGPSRGGRAETAGRRRYQLSSNHSGTGQPTEEISPMLKIVAAGATALFVAASPLAYAQTPSAAKPERLNVADRNTLTDLRIDLVKAALQLTPDQQKLWPPVESAIRARAEDRKARLAKIAETVGKRADENPVDVLRNRDPIAFLQRRAEALAQRSADLDKLAEAWQPLYKTLSPEQRQRMAALAIFVLHDMSDAVERRRAQSENDD